MILNGWYIVQTIFSAAGVKHRMGKPGTRIQSSNEPAIYPLTASNSSRGRKNSKLGLFRSPGTACSVIGRFHTRVLQFTTSPKITFSRKHLFQVFAFVRYGSRATSPFGDGLRFEYSTARSVTGLISRPVRPKKLDSHIHQQQRSGLDPLPVTPFSKVSIFPRTGR